MRAPHPARRPPTESRVPLSYRRTREARETSPTPIAPAVISTYGPKPCSALPLLLLLSHTCSALLSGSWSKSTRLDIQYILTLRCVLFNNTFICCVGFIFFLSGLQSFDMLPSASRPRPPLFVAVAASILLLFFTCQHLGLARQNALNAEGFVPETVQLDQNFGKPAHVERPAGLTEQPQKPDTGKLPCAQLPGGDDVFVAMKTSATEVHQKLPTHLETTFRCIPHYAIFSDVDEVVQGEHVYDVLDEVNITLRTSHPDFSLYREMQDYKSKGKDMGELADSDERQALKLDKWKFLPLMEKALKAKPDAKFYFFMEADTYVVWSNLLRWLQTFDPAKPLYVGGQNWMLDQQFASSGSGIILSRNTLEQVVAQRRTNIEVFDQVTAADYAGDVVLARAMQTVAVPLTGAFPIIQGENPYTLDYTKNHWCHPVVSYHHMTPEWTKAMWEFEQSWMSQSVSSPLLFAPSSIPNPPKKKQKLPLTYVLSDRPTHPPPPRRLCPRRRPANRRRKDSVGQPVRRLRGDAARVLAGGLPRRVRRARRVRAVPLLAGPVPDGRRDTAGRRRVGARPRQPGRRGRDERLGRRPHQCLHSDGRAVPAAGECVDPCGGRKLERDFLLSFPFSLAFFFFFFQNITCIRTSICIDAGDRSRRKDCGRSTRRIMHDSF